MCAVFLIMTRRSVPTVDYLSDHEYPVHMVPRIEHEISLVSCVIVYDSSAASAGLVGTGVNRNFGCGGSFPQYSLFLVIYIR